MSLLNQAAVVAEINLRMAVLLDQARRALTGENVFDVSQVRALLALTSEMEPHIRPARWPNETNQEFNRQIEIYREHLLGLRKTLEQIRMMLVGKRCQLESSQRHMSAVSRWTDAYQQTR
jgi:hypothetical protein